MSKVGLAINTKLKKGKKETFYEKRMRLKKKMAGKRGSERQQAARERAEKGRNPKDTREPGPSTRNTTKPPTTSKKQARKGFFKEMSYEGYKITSLGRRLEKDNYKKSRTVGEYINRNMKYFSGNKEQEGKYWTKTRKPRMPRKSKGDKTVAVGRVEGEVVSDTGYQVTKEEEREKYLKEMANEGYEFTAAGKAEMKRAFIESNNPQEFRKIIYGFIKSGDKYVIKNSKKGSANMDMAAEYCSKDSGTKAGDWFGRF